MKIERPVAGEISGSEKRSLALVPNHEGKVSYQVNRCLISPLLVGEQDEQAVGYGVPVFIGHLKLPKQLAAVVDNGIRCNCQPPLGIIKRQLFVQGLWSNPLRTATEENPLTLPALASSAG